MKNPPRDEMAPPLPSEEEAWQLGPKVRDRSEQLMRWTDKLRRMLIFLLFEEVRAVKISFTDAELLAHLRLARAMVDVAEKTGRIPTMFLPEDYQENLGQIMRSVRFLVQSNIWLLSLDETGNSNRLKLAAFIFAYLDEEFDTPVQLKAELDRQIKAYEAVV